MDVSVVITTFDRAALLRDALESVVLQETGGAFSFEVVVVDNASTDGTKEVVSEIARRAPVPVRCCHEGRRGVAPARNRGLREAAAPWIAFFDDDQLAARDWLAQLRAVAARTGAGCVGGRVTLALEAAGAPPLPAFCRALLGETFHGDDPHPFTGKRTPGTGNVLLHRRVLDAVGGFDERFVYGAEDAELFRRVGAAGFSIWYSPAACVAHRIPAYRLSTEYLRWVASRHGASYAAMDASARGLRGVAAAAALRLAQAAAVTLPSLLRAIVARDGRGRVEARCRLARALGYGRQALRLLLPPPLGRRALQDLEFRAERGRHGAP